MELMSPTTALMSVDEYLRTSYKPACEYRDGILTQKAMPTHKHSQAQFRVNMLIYTHCPNFEAGPELHVRLSESRYLVPDLAVQRKDRIQDPYPTEPIHLCVEILSPDDRFSEVVAKCEEYHAWGVPMVWIIDPVNRVAWEFSPNRPLHEVPPDGSLTAPEIAIPLTEIFSVL
ncbi:MAG: Uma2 family endonuclease [Bryobacteraceae bacterium]